MKPLAFLPALSTLCFCSCVPDTGLTAQEDHPSDIIRYHNVTRWAPENVLPEATRHLLATESTWQAVSSTHWLEGFTPGYNYPLRITESCRNDLNDSPAAEEKRQALRARGAEASVTLRCPGRTRWWEDKTGATYTGRELHKLYQPVESAAEAVGFFQATRMFDPTPNTINLPTRQITASTVLAGANINETFYVRQVSTDCEGTFTYFWKVAGDGTLTDMGQINAGNPQAEDECPIE